MIASSAIKTVFRIVLVTALFSILGFALGGLFGILSVSLMRAGPMALDFRDAIWFGALPGAALGALAGLILITLSERRARPPAALS